MIKENKPEYDTFRGDEKVLATGDEVCNTEDNPAHEEVWTKVSKVSIGKFGNSRKTYRRLKEAD